MALYAPWVHSLKEKRMVINRIISRVRNKFNVSIAEIEHQDIHQRIGIGFVCITGTVSQADRILDTIIQFIESDTEAEIVSIEREIL